MLGLATKNGLTAVGTVAALAVVLSGCGGEEAPDRAVITSPPEAEVAAAPSAAELPSEGDIRAAQSEPIATATTPRSSASADRVASSKDTAPEAVLDRAENAARQWLRYRFDGDAPDPAVIPRAVWDSVPPAAPQERMRGAARVEGVKAVGAHREGGRWVVMLSTRDPRMQDLVIEMDGTTVEGVNG